MFVIGRNNTNNKFYIFDKLLVQLACCLLFVLFLAQAFLYMDGTRKYFSLVDQMEGESISSNRPVADSFPMFKQRKKLRIRMVSPSKNEEVYFTVNGKAVGNFADGQVEYLIADGDYLEIDARSLGEPSRYVVDTLGNAWVMPSHGLLLETQAAIISLGKARLKNK